MEFLGCGLSTTSHRPLTSSSSSSKVTHSLTLIYSRIHTHRVTEQCLQLQRRRPRSLRRPRRPNHPRMRCCDPRYPSLTYSLTHSLVPLFSWLYVCVCVWQAVKELMRCAKGAKTLRALKLARKCKTLRDDESNEKKHNIALEQLQQTKVSDAVSEAVSVWVCVYEWVRVWVYEWVGEWVSEWVSECLIDWLSECVCVYIWVCVCVSEWVSEWVIYCVVSCYHSYYVVLWFY